MANWIVTTNPRNTANPYGVALTDESGTIVPLTVAYPSYSLAADLIKNVIKSATFNVPELINETDAFAVIIGFVAACVDALNKTGSFDNVPVPKNLGIALTKLNPGKGSKGAGSQSATE